MMIPKIIHYCWFGRNPLPKSAKKCIASWRKFLPDYDIKEWNEDNFNVNIIPYTRDAYQAKKYAFVSDYARFWILYHYGGVYFDTDVEVVKPLDDIIAQGAFMGWETPSIDGAYKIAPGLGLGVPQRSPLYADILRCYDHLSFYLQDGNINSYSMIPMITDLFSDKGLKLDGTRQVIDGISIYPAEYFCPMNTLTGELNITDNTRSIHWYTMSWLNWRQRLKLKIGRVYRRLFSK